MPAELQYADWVIHTCTIDLYDSRSATAGDGGLSAGAMAVLGVFGSIAAAALAKLIEGVCVGICIKIRKKGE